METALELIAKERQHQLKLGWSKQHDIDEHDGGELAIAAACYAAHPRKLYLIRDVFAYPAIFDRVLPFDSAYISDKKTEVERLIIAGALIAAEIERLQNVAETNPELLK